MKNKIHYIIRRITQVFTVFLLFFLSPSAQAAMDTNSTYSVYIDDLTSPEIADMIKAGFTTVIIPTGGSEQNHAHMIIGKHNKIVYYTAGEIARRLGKTLVTPVLTYVPEGNITPPEGHMNFAGTLSLREEKLYALLGTVFPDLPLLCADAMDLDEVLKDNGIHKVNAIVSSLPFLMMPAQVRGIIEEQMAKAIGLDGIIVQFTYGHKSPISPSELNRYGLVGKRVKLVLANVPPAHVWVYKRGTGD